MVTNAVVAVAGIAPASSWRCDARADSLPTYVPVLTRVRGEATIGAIPITRSVFRKVVQERAAVLAADAPAEVGSASLLGAQIRSTLGIPLWKGDEILGIFTDELDAREREA